MSTKNDLTKKTFNKYNMSEFHEKFCSVPFINLSISPRGILRPCCVQYENSMHNKWTNIKDNNVNVEWPTPELKKIQEIMLDGNDVEKKLPECEPCWSVERVGLKSYRNKFNKDWIPIIQQNNHEEIKNPSIHKLDLQFGHLCNLSCAMCGPSLSSNLYSTFLKLSTTTTDKNLKDYYLNETQYIQNQKDWTQDTNAYNKLLKLSEPITDLRITGGEPFFNPKFNHFLNFLVHKEKPIKSITIITNGTIYSEEIVKLLNKIDRVLIKFSLESIEEQDEFIRWPTNWASKNDNIKKYVQELNPKNVVIKFNNTINALNILSLKKIRTYLDSLSTKKLDRELFHIEPNYLLSLCNSDPEYIEYCISEYKQQDKIPEVDTYLKLAKDTTQRNTSMQVKYVMDRATMQDKNVAELFPEYFHFHKKYL